MLHTSVGSQQQEIWTGVAPSAVPAAACVPEPLAQLKQWQVDGLRLQGTPHQNLVAVLHRQRNIVLSFLVVADQPADLRDPQVAARDVEFGATPLHWAAAIGDEEVVRLLVHKGADVKARQRLNLVLAHHTLVHV